jgi:predicted phage gp36 major capsid-like protein
VLHVQALERHVTALKANLASKGATLREAQDSLSETEGKLHEEIDKNDELSRDNMALGEQVERLQEELRQSEAVRSVWVVYVSQVSRDSELLDKCFRLPVWAMSGCWEEGAGGAA